MYSSRRRRCCSRDRRRRCLLICVSMIATNSISASTISMTPSLKSSPGGPLFPVAPAYMITKTEQKGIGLVATRKMDIGTLVITESPTLTLRTGFREPEGLAAVASLSSIEEQEQIMSLHDCRAISPMDKSIIGIFQTNALPLGLRWDRGGIFPNIARINHSCLPNMNYYFNEETYMAEMYAIRTINEGDELSWACMYFPPVCYIPPVTVLSTMLFAKNTIEVYHMTYSCSLPASFPFFRFCRQW